MIKRLYYLLGIILLFSTPSCKVLYPNEMFKQKDYQFFELAKKKIEEYVIASGDQLKIQVYSRDGFKLVDVLGGNTTTIGSGGQQGVSTTTTNTEATAISFLVDKEGFVKFPVIGEMFVKGYTQSELESILAQRYSSLFVNPFVILKVSNRRVLVFKGEVASVIPLNDEPTTLIEVLAKAGGLNRYNKAGNIKLIRGDLRNPQVRIIDVSTLEGIRKADMIVQSNDIVYIPLRHRAFTDIVQDVAPIVTILSTTVTVVTLVNLLSKK
jgi:polysaccharide biosynthesis/export protein